MMNDRLLAGRYRMERVLGQGGIARVYRASDVLTGRAVALKESPPGDPSARAAIIDEYKFASLHQHPALVSPYSLINGSDAAFIVMALVEGADLKTWWNSAILNLDPDRMESQADEIMASILECAAFIHFSGYIYNDFKPANFIVVDEVAARVANCARPVLLDYNLVTPKGENPSRRGTLEYISPEVLKGNPPEVTSDLYSIGATIYELLIGAPPFSSTSDSELIKLITETGEIDFSRVPPRFGKGMEALLSRNPEQRPRDAQKAAEILGLDNRFRALFGSRIGFYLSAGTPPFAAELDTSFNDYLRGMSGKVFLIRGLSHSMTASNYLVSKLEIDGYEVYRIPTGYDNDTAAVILDDFLKRAGSDLPGKIFLLVDSLEELNARNIKKLKVIAGLFKSIPVAAGAGRWFESGLPHILFDPLRNQTRRSATAETLKAFLKQPELDFDYDLLSDAAGGDPELVYHHLIRAADEGRLNLLSGSQEYDLRIADRPIPGAERTIERMFDMLSKDQQTVISKLSVWSDRIPMLLLTELNENEQKIINRLIESGHLIQEKDSVAFPSGDSRYWVYSRISPEERESLHRYWAEAAEKRLEETNEYLEAAAHHWGLSDDIIRGFKANLAAATEYLKAGELSRARIFAKTLLSLSEKGGGSRLAALEIYADIAKAEGDYEDAGEKYIKLLCCLRVEGDENLKAKTLKDLGDLNRSLRIPAKALFYIKKALAAYKRLSNEQGIADCLNNMGLTYWVDEQYQKALDSFYHALEANERLGNFRELAKIQSNLGIIKDIMGKTGDVAPHFLSALDHARQAEDPRLQALISNNLGFFLIRQGDFETARKHLQEALEMSERIGYTEEIINSLTNLGLCYLRLGDLFKSVENNQKAQELANSFGNKRLAADAELHLTEACILMGNLSLADNVLASIESARIYTEDKTLKSQVDLLRSKWLVNSGYFEKAIRTAEVVSFEAARAGNGRLRIEAGLVIGEAQMISEPNKALSNLVVLAEQAGELGHDDVAEEAGRLLAETYLAIKDLFNAEGWIERSLSGRNSPRRIYIEASILSAELWYLKGRYDDAVEKLTEIESIAAASGFIPLALRSAVVLGEIFISCLKISRAKEAFGRAAEYREKMLSALPQNVPAAVLLKIPAMVRLEAGLARINEKEFLRV
jgi:tetratricopeptide (TPR) repeat protein